MGFNQTTVFLTVGTMGMMGGVFLSTPLKKWFGKKPLMIFLSLASVVLGGAFYVLPQYNFSSQKVISTEVDGVRSVYAADMDTDGDMDVLSASAGDNKIAWYQNEGAGTFSTQKPITTEASGAELVYAADLDGDGDLDALSVSAEDDTITWYENDGAGNFSNPKLISQYANGVRTVYTMDLDSDGDTDVLSASAAGDTINWNENDSAFNLTLLLVFNFLWSIVAGAIPVFMFAMFSDAADFHEWKFGRRATGLVIAGIMFSIKMGVAIGGFVNLQALGAIGYVANVPQTLEAMRGIKLLFSLVPASIILICGVVLFFYPISEKQLVTIESDLKERKSSEQDSQ